MKRCPECQFLYDNETIQCDMDGTPLRYTVALPSIPGLAKSIWDRWTIALLSAVVLGTVLVILYRATPAAYTSSSPTQVDSANRERAPANQNAPAAEPVAPSDSPAEEQAVDDAATSADYSSESQTPTSPTKVQRSKRGAAPTDEKETSPAPVIHFEPAASAPAPVVAATAGKPTKTETSAEKSAIEKSNQPTSSSGSAAIIHPRPPADYSSKSATESQKKESGFKSFLKKAGKAIKKPFGDN